MSPLAIVIDIFDIVGETFVQRCRGEKEGPQEEGCVIRGGDIGLSR